MFKTHYGTMNPPCLFACVTLIVSPPGFSSTTWIAPKDWTSGIRLHHQNKPALSKWSSIKRASMFTSLTIEIPQHAQTTCNSKHSALQVHHTSTVTEKSKQNTVSRSSLSYSSSAASERPTSGFHSAKSLSSTIPHKSYRAVTQPHSLTHLQ